MSRIADWDIIDFPALPSLGNFCYETVVSQIQIEGHLHLWVQLLTPGYCHYPSFIFNTDGYNLSKLITIFCQMLISSKFVYTYMHVYIYMSIYNSSSLMSSRPWTIFVTSFFHVKLNWYLKICTCPLTADICRIFLYSYDKCYCCQLCSIKLLISVRNPSSTLLVLQYTFHLPSFPHNLISETSGLRPPTHLQFYLQF